MKSPLSSDARIALGSLVRRFHGNRLIGSDEAATYNQWVIPYLSDVAPEPVAFDYGLATMLESYAVSAPLSVADVGSGKGDSAFTILHLLAPSSLALVDLEPKLLEQAKSKLESLISQGRLTAASHLAYNVGRAENLSEVLHQENLDLVVMRRSVRYIAEAKRPSAFAEVYKSLKIGGKLVFDVPVKQEGDWLCEEDTPLSAVAYVLNQFYGVEGIEDVMGIDHNPQLILRQIGKELSESGFSDIKSAYLRRTVNLEIAQQLARKSVEELTMGVVKDHPLLAAEVNKEIENIYADTCAYLRSVFRDNTVTVGITMIKAIKSA